jgi:predicted MFS family arabinose efflux permease
MLLWGYVADRWNAECAYTLGSLALIGCAGLLFVVQPGRNVLLTLYAGLLALGLASRTGGTVDFMGAALCQGRALGSLMGILSAQIALGSAIGPALGGWVFDATGS